MVSVLLMLTRSQRDGVWELYLYSLSRMLPYFMCYDHINYSRWGSIYLANANQLPDAVRKAFEDSYFEVKQLAAQFNQVYPDQGQE